MLRYQLGRDLVLGLHLLLQELNPFLFLLRLAAGKLRGLEGSGSVLEELFLPAVEHRGSQPQLFAQIGNRSCLQDGALERPPSPQPCSACAPFSSVRSAILTDERLLHLQLRHDTPTAAWLDEVIGNKASVEKGRAVWVSAGALRGFLAEQRRSVHMCTDSQRAK